MATLLQMPAPAAFGTISFDGHTWLLTNRIDGDCHHWSEDGVCMWCCGTDPKAECR